MNINELIMLRGLPLRLKSTLNDLKFILTPRTSLLHTQSKPRGLNSRSMTSHVNKTFSMTSLVTSRGVTTSRHTSSTVSPLREPAQPPCCENLHCVPRVGPGEHPHASTLSATILIEARLDHAARRLVMEWNDGGMTEYPYVWLRDSCQCEMCFDEGPCARRLLVNEIDLMNATPVNVQVDGTAQQVDLTWSDGHKSVYRYKWLQDRAFQPARQAMRARWNAKSPPKLWDASFINNIPTLSYDRLIKDKRTQYEWITLLEEVGFVLLKGAPLEMGQIGKIAQQIGFIRMTNYGDTSKVYTKSNPSNLAFSSSTLMLHNDLAYYTYIPGCFQFTRVSLISSTEKKTAVKCNMQMMHCIQQASGEGGKNLFVDGFLAAQQLREQHPDQFKILTDTVLDFYDIGTDFLEYHQMSRHPTIKLDEEGNLLRIAFSTHSRDSYLRMPLDAVEPFYKALNAYTNLLYHPSNLVQLKLQPGDISCFDNWRILHGRLGYNSQAGETRLLEHGYIDWDEMHSKRRVLKAKLGIEDEEY